jgi:hypothetical protein
MDIDTMVELDELKPYSENDRADVPVAMQKKQSVL